LVTCIEARFASGVMRCRLQGASRSGARKIFREKTFLFCLQIWLSPGAVPRRVLGGTVPPTPHKGQFCKSSKTDEKILGVWEVTSPTMLEFQLKFVASGFQRPKLTYILSNF